MQARRSILPELRSPVMQHAGIPNAHKLLWAEALHQLGRAFQRDEAGEVVVQVADAITPFGGLLAKLSKRMTDLIVDYNHRPQYASTVAEEATKSDVDELLDCFRQVLHEPSAIPAVIWLDDAHWIDAESVEWLRPL